MSVTIPQRPEVRHHSQPNNFNHNENYYHQQPEQKFFPHAFCFKAAQHEQTVTPSLVAIPVLNNHVSCDANSVNNDSDNVNGANNDTDNANSVNNVCENVNSVNNDCDNANSVNNVCENVNSVNNDCENVNSVNNDADKVNGNERRNGGSPRTTSTHNEWTRQQEKNPASAIAATPATVTIVEQQHHAVVANTKKTKRRRTSPQSSQSVVATPPQRNESNSLPAAAANGKEDNTPEISPDNVILVKKDSDDVTTTVSQTNNNVNVKNNNSNSDNNNNTSVTTPSAAEAAAAPKTKSWASLFKPVSSSPSFSSMINGEINSNNVKSHQVPDQLAVNGKIITNGDTTAMNGTSCSSGGNEKNNNDNHQVMMKCPPASKSTEQQPIIDHISYKLGEYLLNYTVDGRTISLQPRGLINRSNYCYLNSVLQALLACPPVYNLLSGLMKVNVVKDKPISTPIIDGLCRFVNEYKPLSPNRRRNAKKNKKRRNGGNNNKNVQCDPPFEPHWMYKVLKMTGSDSFLVEGRQEDAEEFLSCLLNGFNEEISVLMDLSRETYQQQRVIEGESNNNDKNDHNNNNKSNDNISNGNNDWNRDSQHYGIDDDPEGDEEIGKTPISEIFGGLLKSEIHRVDDGSTFNIQPFYTLQLHIKKVTTVQQALEALVMKNQLEGLTSSRTNEKVDAWEQVKVEKLPGILVLHLKCFEYKWLGCTKIIKALEFPVDLKIDQRLLSSKHKEGQFKLFAVISHVGEEADRGHYITDTFNAVFGTWLRHDDGSVKPISEEHMLHPEGTQMPYLLFYKRA